MNSSYYKIYGITLEDAKKTGIVFRRDGWRARNNSRQYKNAGHALVGYFNTIYSEQLALRKRIELISFHDFPDCIKAIIKSNNPDRDSCMKAIRKLRQMIGEGKQENPDLISWLKDKAGFGYTF
jgi:hypothetical protein